jgi:eukaryotic-like serine/threonine-protein kinase
MTDKTLFELVVQTPEPARAAMLDRVCGGDMDLRRRLEEMLAAHQSAPLPYTTTQEPPTLTSASEPAVVTVSAESTARIGAGAVIAGRYSLIEQIGEGGMGEVWVAKQSEPVTRKVAIKLIKAGMDSRAVLARFEQERQALAVMDHPNIAKVFDGGLTADRHPFFVMELVHGRPVTRFCDEAKLTVRDRLQLFIAICQAVQHAHQKGIIHRDLKPGNILVTSVDGKPVPKVIDFGVAKAVIGKLTDDTLSTQIGSIIGTLEYMAPEQAGASDGDVDTRADVYSLGIILYELLTGTRPFDRKRLRQATRDEMIRVIKEEEPPSLASRLSTAASLPTVAAVRQTEPRRLVAMVKGELDWIVMKCLEKDRNRRYDTPSSLARDIERFLADEPVEARPASAGYRLWKFYRRNRGPVIAACVVVLALVGGIVGTTWGLVHAEGLRQIAQDNERDAARARTEAETRARAEKEAKHLAQAETKRAEGEKARADTQTDEARRALHVARQQVAMNAWRENRMNVLEQVLERQKPALGEPDLRGFEWAYLTRLTHAPGPRWSASGPMVNGVAIAPDNRTAITVGFDGKATAWDVATGQKRWDTGAALRWSVNAVAIAPDGKTVALAGHLGQLQLWNMDGTPRANLAGHTAQVFGASFSPDGTLLASASADLSVRLWDTATGKAAGTLSASPKLKGPGPVAIPQTNPADSVNHTNMVWQTAWSPDGKRLASCSSDGSVKIWAVPERRPLRTLVGHEGFVVGVAWSPDGRLVASVSRPRFGGSGGEIRLWNPDTGREEATIVPPTGGLFAVAFTPDGLHLVTGGQDHTLRVWRKNGQMVAEHRGFKDDVIGLAVGGDGRWAVAGTRAGEVVALDLDVVPARRSTATSNVTHVAVALDGRLAVFRHNAVQWLDPESLAETSALPAAKAPPPNADAIASSNSRACALRPDGESALSDKPGLLWRDAAGKVRHTLTGHSAAVTAVVFLANDQLASADENGGIRIWSGATGQATATLQLWHGPVRFLAATADGRLWAGGSPWAPGSKPGQKDRPTSKEGRLARLEDGRVVGETTTAGAISAADISPDGTSLVACAGGAFLWFDTHSGKEVRRQSFAATGPVTALRFSPTERRIAASAGDGTVRLLDAESGEELLVLESPGAAPVMSLAFFPDGKQLAAYAQKQYQGGIIVIWDSRPAAGPAPLPAPDAAWHRAQLDIASSSRRDVYAMRYHLTRLDKLEPNERSWSRRLLALAQDAGDYRAAVDLLEGILRRWPDDASMWYDLGNAERERENVAAAEAAFRKCIAVNPAMAEGYCNLGLVLSRDGRFADAAELLRRGHELGMAQQKAGKRWPYSSAAWLARNQRLGEVAARHGGRPDFADVPQSDRADLVEVLLLTRRPLAAIQLADAKPDRSPGPVVIGAALRCAEGIGDADALSSAERSAWRTKALGWLRLDFAGFPSTDPIQRVRMCAGMKGHPHLRIAQGDRVASWPASEREAWQKFWSEVDAASR